MKSENPIKDKSFSFAVRCVKLSQFLQKEKLEYTISKQFLRSGTSIGANVREALNAESKPDFIHKLSIAQKECDESLYWLELMFATNYLNEEQFQSMQRDCAELLKIIRSIIISSRSRNKEQ